MSGSRPLAERSLAEPIASPRLLAITDRRLMGDDPLSRVRSLAERMRERLVVQIREKDLDARILFEWARALQLLCEKHGSRIMINGRLDVVKCLAPHVGLHVPEDGVPISEARRLLPHGTMLGASVHTISAALARAQEGATLVVLSPIFPTASKPATLTGDAAVLGLGVLEQTVRAIDGSAEVFALGGIDASNVGETIDTGVDGVAAVGAVWSPQRCDRLLSVDAFSASPRRPHRAPHVPDRR